eukprot:scaffold1509_cov110-Isochrysis_galbana.AAC.5
MLSPPSRYLEPRLLFRHRHQFRAQRLGDGAARVEHRLDHGAEILPGASTRGFCCSDGRVLLLRV